MSDKQQNSGQMPTDAAKLRKRAEEQARTLEPISLSAQTPETIEQILHELRVHQIELEMQNEQLRSAQEEIEAGRARYFDLYDLAPVGYCTLSEQGLFLEANLTATKLLGVTRNALVKQPISRFILKEDEDIYYLHRKQLFETGESQEYELRLTKPDGTLIWAHLTTTTAQAEDGELVCRLVINDITERKQTDSIIKKYEDNFRNITEVMQETLSVIALNGTFLYANPTATRKMSGGKSENIIGQNLRELIPKVQAESLIEQYQSVYRSGEPFHQEIKVDLQTGNAWFFNTLKPIEYGSPPVPAVLSVSLDITKRKQAEDALRESHAMLTRTEQIANVGSWEWDIKADRVYWSKELFRIFQRDPAIGAPSFAEHPDIYVVEDMDRLRGAVEKCLFNGSPYELELRAIRSDGMIRQCIARGQAQYDGTGSIIRLVGSLQDITERKQVEEALQRVRFSIENLSEGVFWVDEAGCFTDFNAAACRNWGTPVKNC